VKGPLICGSNLERSIVVMLSYSAPLSALRRLSMDDDCAIACAARAISERFVDRRYLTWAGENGKIEVVAPTSAPLEFVSADGM